MLTDIVSLCSQPKAKDGREEENLGLKAAAADQKLTIKMSNLTISSLIVKDIFMTLLPREASSSSLTT